MSSGKTRRKFVSSEAFIAGLSAQVRARGAARARELIAAELTLRDLRKAREMTQVEIARLLGVGQEQVSRLEQRSDMLLSTLASYVEALGGKLTLVAEFPDRNPVTLSGLSDIADGRMEQQRRTRKASAGGSRRSRPATR